VTSRGSCSPRRRDLRTRYPRYAQLSEVELIDATAAAGLPRRNEGFVSYLVLDDEVLAFVATRGAALRVIELGTIPGLEGSIGAYRRLLAGALAADPLPVWRLRDGRYVVSLARPADAVQRVTDPRGVGEALAQRLLRPLEKALAGTTHWVISPDAALATLPFEALPRDGRPLAATRSVTYVQSLSVAALMQARPAAGSAKRDLLAMGAPQFVASGAAAAARIDDASGRLAESLARGALPGAVASGYALSGRRWSPLPGAAREIEAVSALFPSERRVVATGASASEARLRALDASGELAGFRYLLFATHAYLDTEVPARSALVLSQVDLAPGTDGYLTAAKWPAFRLHSDLAVLSACETGLGRAVQGEGVMGLPYALFIAGNRATLLTLWRIDDAGTVAFVSAFFDRLRNGMDPPTALALTKRSFIADRSRRHLAAVWAPFVLYGR